MPGQTIPTDSAGPDSGGGGNPINIFSAGLVQITGLATLVGGSGAEELAIGLKAAPGLPWASISSFGILKIVKVFIAGVAPDRWRYILGLRSAVVDEARGFAIWTKMIPPRSSFMENSSVEQALALSLDVVGGGSNERDSNHFPDHSTHGGGVKHGSLSGWRSNYAFDRSLKATLATTRPFKDDNGVSIVHFTPGTTTPDHRLLDSLMLLASCAKLVEIFTLRVLGSRYLWWSSALGWGFTFAMAVILHWFSVGRENPRMFRKVTDFLIGEVPSFNRPGGSEKLVILDQLASVRNHILWRAAWLAGAVSNTASIGITFYVLARDLETTSDVTYAWVAFQFLWILARSAVYHILPNANAAWNENVTIESWKEASQTSRERVLRLLLAASIQQAHGHLRGFAAYGEDMLSLSSPQALVSVLDQAGWRTCDALPRDVVPVGSSQVQTRVEAILSDVLLRTVAWVTSSKVDNVDMYDTVLVLVSSPSGVKYLTPAVRVMSTKPMHAASDVEKPPAPSFDPKWRMNRDKRGSWIYWLPVESSESPGRWDWLEIKCDPYSVLGPLQNYRVVSDMQLDRDLSAGIFGISLRSSTDMSKVMDASKTCAAVLLHMVRKRS